MRWEFFVSSRYLLAKRREWFISLISLISIAGVALGVAALIVVISVMNGFDREMEDKIIGVNSHIAVESGDGVVAPDELMAEIRKTAHVVSCSAYVNGQAMLRTAEGVNGVIIRGVEPKDEMKTTKIGSYIVRGNMDLGDDGIAIGSELSAKLGLKTGDKVRVVTPLFAKGYDMTVRGIFTSGMYDYDANLAYVGMYSAEKLFGMGDAASGIAIKVDSPFNAKAVKAALRNSLTVPCAVRTWMDSNRNFLDALKLEKTVMFLILTLIVIVACFNIASTLIMTVLEKTKDIGILKAIGSTSGGIMRIFSIQGSLIGLTGTLIGAKLGLSLCWLLKTFKFVQLPKDIYYIDALPVCVEWREVSVIIAGSLLICFIATLYPSMRAARLDPVEALRYE